MKAGILTLHQADNFGAVLQGYALQQTLLRLGLKNELIDLEIPASDEKEEDGLSGAAAVLKKRIRAESGKRKELFDRFRREYLISTGPVSGQELLLREKEYGIFIAGSDQVWNLRVVGADACFFLPFTDPQKRVSYAASFGSEDLPENAVNWCAARLKDFTFLSVREASGQELVKKLTGRGATLSLDPVFLPEPGGLRNLISPRGSDPYYFVYMLDFNEGLLEHAERKSRETGIPLKIVTAAFVPRFGFDAYSNAGVTDWLSLLAESEGVFTDSFHGTAFSLIFGKPFSVSGPAGKISGRSGRITELLERAGMASAYDSLSLKDSGSAASRLLPYREASLSYLKEVAGYAKNL